jgi:hypothetical protein
MSVIEFPGRELRTYIAKLLTAMARSLVDLAEAIAPWLK